MAAADSAAWATLCPEILLAILRTPAVVAAASRVCRHWRTCATLVTAAEGAHFASDAEMRRFCAACPELGLLRVDPDARVSDVGAAGVALLSELRTFALTGWTATGERTLAALATLAALSSVDLSWCALLSDQAIRNLASGARALRSLSLRGCRRIGDAPVAELLRSASALTHLDLSFCVQVGNEAVCALGGMRDLRTLSMRSLSRVTGDGAAAIGALHSLTELDVSYCSEIASQSLDSWTSLCSLRVVALSGCGNITSFGVGRLLMAWTTLETLDLFNVPNLSDLALSYALPALTRLRCLDISHNPHLSARSVSLLSHLTNLTDLSASGLHGVEPAAFGAILALTALRALGLHSNHGLPSYILSAMSRRLTGLTQLGLRHCCSHRDNEHDASCSGDVFSGLRRSMRHLDLSYSRLGSAPQLSHLESLESLHLCGCCEVTDDVLSRIARLPNLYTLDLGRCDGVTDEGLALLAPASRLSALQLHGCTKVTDRGIRALSRLPSLASLDVCECCVGDEGLCALAQPALRSLNALNCAGSVSDAAVTHVATALTALTSLHMDLAAVRSVDSVARLSNLRALTQLDVAKFRSELLPGLAQATSLRSLIVANASGSAEFAALATLELESLQILRCPDVKPSDLVAGLAQCGRLCHVVLLDCPHITAAGLAPLAPRTTALQEISVSVFHENPATVLDTLRAHFPAASLTAYVDGNEVGHA